MSCNSSCSGKDLSEMCPSRMNDARAFTDYRFRCEKNAELMSQVAASRLPLSSYDSRMYLQKNARKIIEQQRARAIQGLSPCAPCLNPTNPSTMLDSRYVVRCDKVSCTRTEMNNQGVGDYRAYSS